MISQPSPSRSWPRTLGLVALVCAILPLIGVLLFFARFALLFVGVPLAVAAGLAYAFSPRLRGWLDAWLAEQFEYKGLVLPLDAHLATGHAWARWQADGAVIGSDALGPTVLGPVSSVELPETGRFFQRGEPLVHLRRGSREVVLRAPIAGIVAERNAALHWHPELVNDQPYGDGWLLRMQGQQIRSQRDALRHGTRARKWFASEVDRLVGLLGPADFELQAAADGGALVERLHEHIDDEAWPRVCHALFDASAATTA